MTNTLLDFPASIDTRTRFRNTPLETLIKWATRMELGNKFCAGYADPSHMDTQQVAYAGFKGLMSRYGIIILVRTKRLFLRP